MALDMVKVRLEAERLLRFIEDSANDPEVQERVYLLRRCPDNMSPERYGLALHKSSETLHAHRDTINSDTCVAEHTPVVPVLPSVREIIIIAQDPRLIFKVGSFPSKWTVHPLRYAKGYLAITDNGQQTASFPSVQHLFTAIKQSGWRIIR